METALPLSLLGSPPLRLLTVCVQHDARFGSKVLSRIRSFFEHGQQPGRYDMKALVNGACRRIGGKDIAWPALIEKGYMKLMGGYDFPGSNSAIDLHQSPASSSVLTGWIPEHVGLQSAYFEKERTWTRMFSGFCKGCCVLTVGTDSNTMRKVEGVKLLPSHDYAVIDVRETDNERWMTLLDSRVPAVRQSPGTKENQSRTLNMRWDDICATFEGVYISWDPGLFKGQLSFHGVWKPKHKDDEAQTCHLRLLYTYQPQTPPVPSKWLHSSSASSSSFTHSDGDVWILLTRHLSDTRRHGEYISLSAKAEDEDEEMARAAIGEMNLKGSYTTSSHVLVRTKVQADQPCSSSIQASTPSPLRGAFSILASYDGVEVRWDESAGVGGGLGYGGSATGGSSMKVEGTLTTKNAGGSHTHPTYMLNPQWHFHIPEDNARQAGQSGRGTSRGKTAAEREKASIVLNAQGPRGVPLNVTAVWSTGERVVELAQKEVVATSGAYTYGHARVAAKLAAGDYTLILSAFEPQVHLGAFTLQVQSSRPFELTPIPQEGAGMPRQLLEGRAMDGII
ncbi:hypothetical protein F5I97DRAFT_1832020 [Phlebopus sp. FC_14]|nr:hypothetical protein F5I97DRAFT_1832020 [Phlebopus sp. FC_14]